MSERDLPESVTMDYASGLRANVRVLAKRVGARGALILISGLALLAQLTETRTPRGNPLWVIILIAAAVVATIVAVDARRFEDFRTGLGQQARWIAGGVMAEGSTSYKKQAWWHLVAVDGQLMVVRQPRRKEPVRHVPALGARFTGLRSGHVLDCHVVLEQGPRRLQLRGAPVISAFADAADPR